jgi:hypothetical protein
MKTFIFFLIFSTSALAHGSVCVLSFERSEHFTTKVISKTFKKKSNHKIVTLAKPIDIVKCVQEGYSEIVIVAHAIYNPNKKNTEAKLGYYRTLRPIEYKTFVSNVEKLHKEYGQGKRKKVSFLNGRRKVKKNEEYKRWEHLNSVLKDISSERVFYKMDKFHTTIFKRLKALLHEQATEGNLKLTKIRIASCMKDSLQKRYTILNEISHEFNIELDWHPDSKFASWIQGNQSVQLEKSWLKESLGR